MKLSELTQKLNEALDNVENGKSIPKNTILQPTEAISALLKGEKPNVPLAIDLYKATLVEGDDSVKAENALRLMVKDTVSFDELKRAIKTANNESFDKKKLDKNEDFTGDSFNAFSLACREIDTNEIRPVLKNVVPEFRKFADRDFVSFVTGIGFLSSDDIVKLARYLKEDIKNIGTDDLWEDTTSDLKKQLIDLGDKSKIISKQIQAAAANDKKTKETEKNAKDSEVKDKGKNENDSDPELEKKNKKDLEKTTDEKCESLAKTRAKNTLDKLFEDMKLKSTSKGKSTNEDKDNTVISSKIFDDDDNFDVANDFEDDFLVEDRNSNIEDDILNKQINRGTLPKGDTSLVEENFIEDLGTDEVIDLPVKSPVESPVNESILSENGKNIFGKSVF